MKVQELVGEPLGYRGETWVTELSTERNLELASATVVFAHKPPRATPRAAGAGPPNRSGEFAHSERTHLKANAGAVNFQEEVAPPGAPLARLPAGSDSSLCRALS